VEWWTQPDVRDALVLFRPSFRVPIYHPWMPRSVLVVLGLALILALGGGAYVLLSRPDAAPLIPTRVELPVPGASEERAMRLGGGDSLGWSWVNPRPRAMPNWYDAEMGQGGSIAMVGPRGQAARFDGDSLRLWPTGVSTDLYGLAFVGPTQALVVGDEGTLVVLLESGPRAVDSGTSETLRSVLAIDTLHSLVVGDGGTFLRIENLRARSVDTGRSEALLGVALVGSEATLVGERGLILSVSSRDEVRVEREPSGHTLRAVGGCGGGDLYAVGDEGSVLRRTFEGRWEPVHVDSEQTWTDLGCDRGRTAATGSSGDVLLLSGDESVILESGDSRALTGIASLPGEPSFVVGDGGKFAMIGADHIILRTAGPSQTFLDLDSLGGLVFGVGPMGRMARQREGRMVDLPTGVDTAFSALARLSEERLVAVGDAGHVMAIYWDRIEALEAPGDASWRDVIAEENTLLAVGTRGQLLRGTPGAFRLSQLPVEATMWAVAGTPSDAIVAGDGGKVFTVRETGVREIVCPEGDTLRGAARTPLGDFLVGDDARILRHEDGRCVREHSGEGTLHAVGMGPNGRPLAVGSSGLSLERGESGAWSEVDLGAGPISLRALLTMEREVLVGGAGGTILRHPRMVVP
jgi:hypothetical protein